MSVHEPASPAQAAGLTPREQQVLALLATGLSNTAIADELSISPRTVGHHTERIYWRIGARSSSGQANRVKAALFAVEAGLVDLPD